MSGNSFGNLFRITSCGESHGVAIAVIIDGCPANFELSVFDIQKELNRRKPGQSNITTPRSELDQVEILSGVYEGFTTGAPILLLVYNNDAQSKDYEHLKNVFRPGHADYTYYMKYGIRDHRGGGRSSARETIARVAAGSIAKKWLADKLNVEILSYVEQVGHIKTNIDYRELTLSHIDSHITRCPDVLINQDIIDYITFLKQNNDSIGGAIRCVIKNPPVGLGAPVFDKLNADLAKAMFSINAVKGFDIGAGFDKIATCGSKYNDLLYYNTSKQMVNTKSNNAGGINGGISNGEDILCRILFKPVSTIAITQNTLDINFNEAKINATGRHDPCVLPRAVPIVDAMAALVIMDHYLLSQAYNHNSQNTSNQTNHDN